MLNKGTQHGGVVDSTLASGPRGVISSLSRCSLSNIKAGLSDLCLGQEENSFIMLPTLQHKVL